MFSIANICSPRIVFSLLASMSSVDYFTFRNARQMMSSCFACFLLNF